MTATPFYIFINNYVSQAVGGRINNFAMVNAELKARFLSLYCMILADGVIDNRELDTLYRIGIENYGLSPEEITQSVREAGTSFIIPVRLEDKVQLLYELAMIAWADEVLEDSEIQLIRNYALRMGFEPENVPEITQYLLDKAHENAPSATVINEIMNQ